MASDKLCFNSCFPRKGNKAATATTIGAPVDTEGSGTNKFKIYSSNPMCSVCNEVAAARFCDDCDLMLCAECEEQSHSASEFKSHRVVDLGEGPMSIGDEEHEEHKTEHKKDGDGHGDGHHREPKPYLDTKDKIFAGVIGFCSLLVVIIMCVWAQKGLQAKHPATHLVESMNRPGFVEGSLYTTPSLIQLPGTQKQYFEVRLFVMSTRDFTKPPHHDGVDGERRLLTKREKAMKRAKRSLRYSRLLSGAAAVENAEHDPQNDFGEHGPKGAAGTITVQLLSDDNLFWSSTVALKDGEEELEYYQTVDVEALGAHTGENYYAYVYSNRTDGQEQAIFLEVVRMSGTGRYRVVVGLIIFLITFVGIIGELCHRVYCAMIGASAVLCAIAAIQETIHLGEVVQMVDFDTTMLLFSMMILMKMVQETGFFNWFAIKVVRLSKQDPKILFFALSNLCGILSMFLDNVTCVLLFGPLTYSLAKQMKLNPRPLYLAMTIIATIGGTATLIGDPPNIVLGSKLKIGFMTFIYYNGPIIALQMPVATYFLWWRLKADYLGPGERELIDLDTLEEANKIVDMPKAAHLAVIFACVILALLLSPLHNIEAAWFTVMAMFACGILFKPHNIHHYLEFVEWDTLLFFAFLFVLVEGLSSLGVISMIADNLIAIIISFPVNMRIWAGISLVLWVSALGSAFLESLPFTCAMAYVLLDLFGGEEIDGLDPRVLQWPLSVGVCIGGIGSILGASANLVCLAISERYGANEEETIKGSDFLKHGLPLLIILTLMTQVYHLFIFAVCHIPPVPGR